MAKKRATALCMQILMIPKIPTGVVVALREDGQLCYFFTVSHHIIKEKDRLWLDVQAKKVSLSERDSLCVLDALENPPHPNAKLLAAAKSLPSAPNPNHSRIAALTNS